MTLGNTRNIVEFRIEWPTVVVLTTQWKRNRKFDTPSVWRNDDGVSCACMCLCVPLCARILKRRRGEELESKRENVLPRTKHCVDDKFSQSHYSNTTTQMKRATNERTHARLRLVVKNFLSASKSRWPDFLLFVIVVVVFSVSSASSFIFISVSICALKKILRRIFASRAEYVFHLAAYYESKNSKIWKHFSRQQLKCRENDGRSSRRERLSEQNKYRKKIYSIVSTQNVA